MKLYDLRNYQGLGNYKCCQTLTWNLIIPYLTKTSSNNFLLLFQICRCLILLDNAINKLRESLI